MDIRYHFKRLVRIAKNANQVNPETFDIIYSIGIINGLDEDFISKRLAKKTKIIQLENIDPWKRFKYFYSLVQLMRMDQNNHGKELQFCFELANWLGYDPVFLNKLITGIFFSDNPVEPVESVRI